MKQRPYLFLYDDKFLEGDSLIEIRAGLDPDQWESLVKDTINAYLQMCVITKAGPIDLDNKERRTFRRLKRTISFIEKLDPMLHNIYCTEEAEQKLAKFVDAEVSRLEPTVRISNDNDDNVDIIVSKL